MALTKDRKTELIGSYRTHDSDTGSPEVQVAILSERISYLTEHELEFPGVQLASSYLRKYPHQSLAAHLLGYVGEITEPQLKAKRSQGYKLGDVIGQGGIEATYDKYLRGRDGSAQLTVDSRGRPTRRYPTTPRTTIRAGTPPPPTSPTRSAEA